MPPTPRRSSLAPSLLSADFGDLGSSIRAAEAAGADAFHLDVMDGHFVPNLSFGPALVAAVRARTQKLLDVHLMIEEPLRYVEAFAQAGGDTLVAHVEARSAPADVIREIHRLGKRAGLALKPETPFSQAAPFLSELDELMVMGVHPGFSGQRFLPSALPKLREARREIDPLGREIDLAIDGGITVETARLSAEAGATFFVCGQSVFAGGTIDENLRQLRRAVEEGGAGAVP